MEVLKQSFLHLLESLQQNILSIKKLNLLFKCLAARYIRSIGRNASLNDSIKMPDIELSNYAKQTKFSNKTTELNELKNKNCIIDRTCCSDVFNDLVAKENRISKISTLEYSNKTFSSLLQLNSECTSARTTINLKKFNRTNSTMSTLNLDYHSTSIEIDSNLDLQKDDHLLDFNQLEDIFNFCNPRNTIQIKLRKGLRGLGISLCGGKLLNFDEPYKDDEERAYLLINQLIRVKKLYPAHPASECGLLDENDFILDVNDHCFVGLTYIDAFNILHSVQEEVKLRILKFNQCPLQKYLLAENESSLFESSSSYFGESVLESTRIGDLDESTDRQIRNVVLVKKDGSLGFTLSKIENGGFYIKQITKSPATEEKIYPGDRILSVNGRELEGLDLNDAIKLLRSLPDLCEFKLEQQCDSSASQTDTGDNSLNYQSETEEDNRSKKKQLRYEVKIMLNSRNKDSLHNRLKRKELKKSKDNSKRDEKMNRTIADNKSNSDDRLVDSGLDSRFESSMNSRSPLSEQDSNLNENRSNETRFDKENFDIFTKMAKDQPKHESTFFRQSSVMEFSRNESNVTSLDKQNNLNKWRNQVMILNDEREDEDCNRNQLNEMKSVCSMKKSNHLNELNDHDEQDSGFGGDLMARTNRTNQSNLSSNQQINLSKSNAIRLTGNRVEDGWNREGTLQLADIEVKMNENCMANENAMYRNIENALFFYVVLDRIGWHGRLGFSLTDDEQYKDFRIVNTFKHGFSACIVKEIYPNSLAYSNGNINIGDKLLEVNNQSMINKPVQTVINELRKLKGKLRLLFLRKVCQIH